MPPPEDLDFELIRQVQLNESRSQNLTKVAADFFPTLADHITELRSRAREEAAADPVSARATLVQNELRSTIRLAQEIVMLRLRKIANRSVDALEGGKVDLRNLTPTEKELYGQLASFMASSREGLLPSDKGRAEVRGAREGTAVPPVPVIEEPAAGETSVEETPEAPLDAGALPQEGEEDALVHVLEDMPPFVGDGGRNYELRKGDLVNLPGRMVEVLVEKGVVERVSDGSQADDRA
jgi:DNA replication initiation complex subunit (GINS family)